jgi:hypothetical protein
MHWHPSTKQLEIVGRVLRILFLFLQKMVLLRRSVGAVGAGSVPDGAVGGALFGVLRLGERSVPKFGLRKQGQGSRSRVEGR